MGMTMSQKILAAAAGLDKVEAGQLIEAKLDLVLGNDITASVAIHELGKFKKKEVFDKVLSDNRLETLQAIDDVNHRRNLSKTCNSVKDVMEDLKD